MGKLAKELSAAGGKEPSDADKLSCPICRMTFQDFKNTGRLGCPYDYEVFREELMPLLENIHEVAGHAGKVPKKSAPQHRAADHAHSTAQRSQPRGRGGRLRDRSAGSRQDQDDRAGTRIAAGGAFMTCDKCQSEASLHLTEVVQGKKREFHLCPSCAREAGLAPAEGPAGLESMIEDFLIARLGEALGELARKSCPLCGFKFIDFRSAGKLGCPNDYEVFSSAIAPYLIETQGASRHVGKRPSRIAPGLSKDRLGIRARLKRAIGREDYEEAARLRDRLGLEGKAS